MQFDTRPPSAQDVIPLPAPAEKALPITPDMLVQMPIKGREVKNGKLAFENGMATLPIFTLLIIVVNIIIFIWEISSGVLFSEESILRAGALKRDLVFQAEYWRLVTAAFLHGSWAHLSGNMIFLYILGMATEHAFGVKRATAIYLFSLLSGSLLSMAMLPGPSVGASGAIFGLMGALIAFFWKYRTSFSLRDGNIGVFIAIIAIIQISASFSNPYIDNYAHIGGFLGGGILALLLEGSLNRENAPAPRLGKRTRGFILASLFGIGCLFLAFRGYADSAVANVSSMLGRPAPAIEFANRSLTLNKDNVYAYIIRGRAYSLEKKYDNAIQDIQVYINSYPNDSAGYSELSDVFYIKKDYAAAIQSASQALTIHPSPGSYNHRGYCKLLTADYKGAREDFRNTLRLDPNCASAYGNLGLLDAIAGSYDSAIAQIEKYYQLDNSFKGINDLITALKAEKKGEYRIAANNYQSFLKKTQDNPSWRAENQFALKRLNSIKSRLSQ